MAAAHRHAGHRRGFAEGAVLGNDAVVGAFCFVARGAVVGAGTRIQSHTSVWEGVELGEDVFVGPAVVFTNVRHPRAAFPRAPHWDRTHVEDGASLGAGCVLVAPVRVGRCALVGAGAVVTRSATTERSPITTIRNSAGTNAKPSLNVRAA